MMIQSPLDEDDELLLSLSEPSSDDECARFFDLALRIFLLATDELVDDFLLCRLLDFLDDFFDLRLFFSSS